MKTQLDVRRPETAQGEHRNQAAAFLVGSIVVTVLLYHVIPYGRTIGYPLMLLSTLVHELGHGIAAMLVGGSFDRFEMYADGSGVAYSRGAFGRFSRAFISAGGLVGPALIGGVGFVVGRSTRGARVGLAVFGVVLLVALILVVRSVFGVAFVAATVVLCLGIALRAPAWVSQVAVVFIAVQLALSVFSRGDYLFTQWAETGSGRMPSDVQQMSEALFLPYWFWGAACGLISVVVLLVGLRVFFGGGKGAKKASV